MSITFDISPDILEKYSEQDLKDIFEIVLIKIKRGDYVYDNKEGIFYDEDGVPLNKDGQIELTQINYKDLPENAKKKFDAMEKGELTFVDY